MKNQETELTVAILLSFLAGVYFTLIALDGFNFPSRAAKDAQRRSFDYERCTYVMPPSTTMDIDWKEMLRTPDGKWCIIER